MVLTVDPGPRPRVPPESSPAVVARVRPPWGMLLAQQPTFFVDPNRPLIAGPKTASHVRSGGVFARLLMKNGLIGFIPPVPLFEVPGVSGPS